MLAKQSTVSAEPNFTPTSSSSERTSYSHAQHVNSNEEICTIFIIGFPDDFKERELVNMFLFAPGYETAVLKTTIIPSPNHTPSTSSTSTSASEDHFRKQLIGFVKFSKSSEATYALEILNGRILDQERGLVLKAEIAKKNLFVKAATTSNINSSNSNNNNSPQDSKSFSNESDGDRDVLGVNGTTASTLIINPSSVPITHKISTLTRAMSITLPGQSDPLLIQAPANNISDNNTQNLHISIPVPSIPIPSHHHVLNSSSTTPAFPPSSLTLRPSSLPKSFQYSPSPASLYINRTMSPLSVTTTHDIPILADLSNLQKTLITSSASLGSMAAIVGENFPCNTVYVGNLPPIASEDELRTLFRNCLGYRRLSFRPKTSGPMCFVEFDDIACATAAIETLYGTMLSCSTSIKGGIRLSFSKNPLGLRVASPVPLLNSLVLQETLCSSSGSETETTHPEQFDHQQAISSIFAHYYKHNSSTNTVSFYGQPGVCMKNCRHLTSISAARLSERLNFPDDFFPEDCKCSITACHTSEKCEDSTSVSLSFVCLTCLKVFCQNHLISHSHTPNHYISFKLTATSASAITHNIETEFYCGQCKGHPSLKGNSKKELVLLEKIKTLILERPKEKKPVLEDKTVISIASTTTSPKKKNKKSKTKDHAPVESSSSSLNVTSTTTPKGLLNLGNTCFMNSALQLLAATLQHHRLDSTLSSNENALWASLATVLQDIYSSGKRSSANPKDFLSLLTKKHKKFGALQQQDSHDFLRLLFNSISEGSNSNSENKPVLPHQFLFGGEMVSRVVCSRCRYVSDTTEPFLDISLALNTDDTPDIKVLQRSLSNLSIEDSSTQDNDESESQSEDCLKLSDLMTNWNRKCRLEGENGYYCEKCSPTDTTIIQDATLQYFLSELPNYLMFHLQRFKFSIETKTTKKGKKTGQQCASMVMEKDPSDVQFPQTFTIPSQYTLNSSDSSNPLEYSLYGYIIHEGSSMSSGHYTAVVKTIDSRWFYASDTRVSEIGEKKALDYTHFSPYLLFYKRSPQTKNI